MIRYNILILAPAAFLLVGCVDETYHAHHENMNPFLRPFTDPVYMPNHPNEWYVNPGYRAQPAPRHNDFEYMLMRELFGSPYY